MNTQPEFIEFTPAFRKITTALIAALLVALYSGCTPQTPGPSPLATGGPSLTPAVPNAQEPITLEILKDGDLIKATDASGAVLPKQNNEARQGEKHYLFSIGMTTYPSVPNQAVCLIEDRQGLKSQKIWCWANDRSAWIRVNSRGIQDVYYVSDDGSSQFARPPAGTAASPAPVKEYWFGRQPQQPLKAAVGPLCVQKCIGNYCWCR
jgi:hypothetical protein